MEGSLTFSFSCAQLGNLTQTTLWTRRKLFWTSYSTGLRSNGDILVSAWAKAGKELNSRYTRYGCNSFPFASLIRFVALAQEKARPANNTDLVTHPVWTTFTPCALPPFFLPFAGLLTTFVSYPYRGVLLTGMTHQQLNLCGGGPRRQWW